MMRTTIDIDNPIFRDLKELQKKRRLPLGKLVSELLAKALTLEKAGESGTRPFQWEARPMGRPRVDLLDKDAVWRILDAGAHPRGKE